MAFSNPKSVSISGPGHYALLPAILALTLGVTVPVRAGEEDLGPKELSVMTLEELMDVSIRSPAAITSLNLDESPASVTSLTFEDIQRTPARNLMDLIEIYVPGAIWMNYEGGPLVGVRGSIGARNGRYLLLVNGKVLSSKGHYGAKSEIELWDLGDIQRLDIIRGPGSVTYGPGAVAGVISITTHDSHSRPRTQATARYVHTYGSTGASLSHGSALKNLDFLAYGGVTRTPGYLPLSYQGSNDNHPGYVGRDIKVNGEPLDYFSDYMEVPQAKLYANIGFLHGWRAWARYTQQGATWNGNESKTPFGGELLNQQSIRDRQFSTELEYRKQLRPDLEIQVRTGALFFDVERRMEGLRGNDPENPANFKYNYSESEYMTGTRVNYQPMTWLEAALGVEVSFDSTGPGWGDGPETMRTGGDGIIVSGLDSKVLGDGLPLEDAIFADNGWSTLTYSAYAETRIHAGPLPTLLVSGRADKNTHSQWLFSPRAALIYPLPGHQTLKAIVQRSMHRNESGELFVENLNGTRPSYESMLSYELIYQARLRNDIGSNFAFFYNDADVISWDPIVDRSLPLGNLRLAGLESELAWTGLHSRIGASYSVLQQVRWKMAPGVTSSGISYADYDQALRSSQAVQKGYGEDLNNWPNQALKVFGNHSLSEKVSLHGNAQFFWDYQGSKDGLSALERAAQGDSLESQVEEALRKVREENVFGLNSRINLWAQYSPVQRVKVSLSVMNLLGTGTNRRHAYDDGNNRLSPHRVRFVREARTVAVNVGYSL